MTKHMPVCLVLAAALLLTRRFARPGKSGTSSSPSARDKEHQLNKFLAERIEGLPPGRALDIGMGQGCNSLFLAALGWEVTGSTCRRWA